MSIHDEINNEVSLDESGVWILKGHEYFNYSDGKASEKYLEKVLQESRDLSCESEELSKKIKDWPSEYHLSEKRHQLLSGFNYNSDANVLEIGCGCGAITRFLDENFSTVTSIEGSLPRAKLAKLRTRDLDSVSLLCAPFQSIDFKNKFDYIFCIGVFEYSASFFDTTTPYETALKSLKRLLSPGGALVIAIENQFGHKYLNNYKEDHTGRAYEGIEGYPLHGDKVRTFGHKEIENKLNKQFDNIVFYYPFPDYKIPDAVLSHNFLKDPRSGELISQLQSRDYYGNPRVNWDEKRFIIELSKNEMLPFFSNSFLIFCSSKESQTTLKNNGGVIFSPGRSRAYKTQTTISKTNSSWVTKKTPSAKPQTNPILSIKPTESEWIDSESLETKLYLAYTHNTDINTFFSPCKTWITYLLKNSDKVNGKHYIKGENFDSTWSNFYEENGQGVPIDQEWVWHKNIPLNVIVIRAIYLFIFRLCTTKNSPKIFPKQSLKEIIEKTTKKSRARHIEIRLPRFH